MTHFLLKCALNVIHFTLVNRKSWIALARLRNSANVLAARSKLHRRLQVVSRALLTGALFYAWTTNASQCPADRIDATAQVRHVHDGDTLWLTDGRKIRLIGINTPEVARKQRPAQPFANQAREHLIQQLHTSENRIGLRYGIERQDKYQRTLAHIYLPNGTNLQASLVRQGLATAFTTPPNASQADCYKQVEQQARRHKTGIWSLPQYQVKLVQQLTRRDKGFRVIQGRVLRVERSKKASWLHLANQVRIRIDHQDRHYFSVAHLNQLTQRNVQLHGWLHPDKQGFFMRLRHPSALTVLE